MDFVAGFVDFSGIFSRYGFGRKERRFSLKRFSGRLTALLLVIMLLCGCIAPAYAEEAAEAIVSEAVVETEPAEAMEMEETLPEAEAGANEIEIIDGEDENDRPEDGSEERPVEMTLVGATVGVGQKVQLQVVNAPEDVALKFSTSDKSVCTVDKKGNVKGVGKGTAVITVVTANDLMATATVQVKAAPGKIKLSEKKITIAVDEEFLLTYEIPESSMGSVTWSSSNKKVAVVDSEGNVKAVGAGTANIVAKTHNGKKATCKVTVKAAPEWLRSEYEEVTVGIGQQVEDLFSIPKGSYTELIYDYTTSGVVKMDGNSMVATGLGETELTATTHNGHFVTVKVHVLPAPQSIAIAQETIKLSVKQQGKVEVNLPEGTHAGLTFKSSNEKIVKVSAKGALMGVKAGSATITVTTHNGLEAECKVTVGKAPTKITLKDESVVMFVGNSRTFAYELPKNTVADVTWAVSDDGVLKVTEDGTVTAVGEGSASVQVKTHNGKKDTVKVRVYDAPSYLYLQDDYYVMGEGQQLKLEVYTDADYPNALQYASADTKVAKVNEDGVIKAVGQGSTSVTVSTTSGRQAVAVVKVYPAPKSVSIPDESIVLGVGESYTIKPILPMDCHTELTYEVSNSCISVTEDGVVTAEKAGTGKVRVKTHNGKTAVMTVKVGLQPEEIKLSEESLTLEVGGTAKLEYELPKGTMSAVSWYSNNVAVCTVDDEGNIKSVGKGTAYITVMTSNGKADFCSVQCVETAAYLNVANSLTITVGESKALDIDVRTPSGDKYAGTVAITSSDPTIAKIMYGSVYGKAAGTCTVQVKAGNCVANVTVTVKGVSNDSRRDVIVAACLEKLGCKYVYAHSGPDEFDCAGLVYYAYKQVGIKVKYSAQAQGYHESLGPRLEVTELLPGDVVCFNTNETDEDLSDHTGIYIGDGKFVHASSAGGKVMISDLSTGYYARTFSWGRRVLSGEN